MVSPPFFFPLIFYALIYLSFVLATTITNHDDNWQPKKTPPAHQPTPYLLNVSNWWLQQQ